MKIDIATSLGLFISLFSLALLAPAAAHCDTLDGPVVQAAENALDTGDVNLVLIWVQEMDEAEIKEAFNRTLEVRGLSPEAKELADMYFFETLVRIHRAGEGAPYTGLKPAGLESEPAILAADRALMSNSSVELIELLTDEVENGTSAGFENTLAKKNFSADDVTAGREYVEAYVAFVHYVEKIYEAARAPAQGHFTETELGIRGEHIEAAGAEHIE